MKFIRHNYQVFLETAVIGVIFIFICMIFADSRFGPVMFVNAAFVVAAYAYLRLRFARWMDKRVEAMSRELRSVLLEQKEVKPPDAAAGDMRFFYDELESVSKELKKADKDRQELLGMINSIAVSMDFDKVMENLLPRLTDVTASSCCAFYGYNKSTNKLEIKNSVGFSKNLYSEFDLALGEGFIGLAAAERKTTLLKDIPEDTVYTIRTFLGKIKPKSMLVAPIFNSDALIGALVFAGIYDYTAKELEMIEVIRYYVGIAAGNGKTYEETKRLSNELRFQNKLIQNLNEDLEKKVESRSLYLTNIIDSISDYAIYTMDRHGAIMTWSKGAEEMMGYSSEEAIGRHVENLYDPGDREAVNRRMQAALADGSYTENGWRVLKDGQRQFFEMRLFCIYNDKNEVIGLSNITRDLTRIKYVESDILFEKEVSGHIMEKRASALLLTDAGGSIIMANRSASQLLDEELLAERNICNFFEESIELLQVLQGMSMYSNGAERTFKRRGEDFKIKVRMTAVINEVTGEKRVVMELAA